MVAPEAVRGDKTAQEIAAGHKTHPTQVTTLKRSIDGLTGVFFWQGKEGRNQGTPRQDREGVGRI
ncbi:hypothetical protein [Puniceibacterium confluentis]|uniref:hypothetical protein n=1 Tax=Puniceibacterium confluentis TaxID=1958944 RepID=UPI0011B70E43|nr:hypothetical protein [Puniceibacterium confluentis]